MMSLADRVRKEEPEMVQVNVRMRADLKQALVDLAAQEGVSLTDVMTVACEDALERYKEHPAKRRRKSKEGQQS